MTEPVIDAHTVDEETLLVRLAGAWQITDGMPSVDPIVARLEATPSPRLVSFDTRGIVDWDSSLVTLLTKIIGYCDTHKIAVDADGLPDGVNALLRLASAVPERDETQQRVEPTSLTQTIGTKSMELTSSMKDTIEFLGEIVIAFQHILLGKGRLRRPDFWLLVQEVGVQALPIVTLISFLVGLILAFIGAVQLQQFGAQIYVADLVALGMAREMGAMMTAVIMAGRTGAAFAARLGTMTVNEEIDALKTMGISPMEFLVAPRILALALMMPLLCVYSDLMGILGGFFVGVSMLQLDPLQYYYETLSSVAIVDFATGLIKAAVYGVLVAFAGCYRGMQCGRSAAAVGAATTSAVVTAIVLIVVASAVLTVIYDVLGY